MARINFVVPRLHKHQFSGGLLCVMHYAHGLARRGHTVSLIPIAPSETPAWFTPLDARVCTRSKHDYRRAMRRALGTWLQTLFAPAGKRERNHARARLFANLAVAHTSKWPSEIKLGTRLYLAREHMPEADVTVATGFETALPTALYGTGRLYYFAQHFEPYFKDEMADPEAARREAELSYRLGLRLIANSPWLQQLLREFSGCDVARCPNAIDHEIFRGEAEPRSLGSEVRIISYGGRNARWKGFAEMAEAMRIARSRLPDKNLRWLVYGDSLLPPDNPVAPYEALGFLQPPQLARAYAEADILLSASWYESFPLFPLEAMACGKPVITTATGTEDYAHAGLTAEIVPARDPAGIAEGIVRLIRDDAYRNAIAARGRQMALSFTWERSVQTMEALLLDDAAWTQSARTHAPAPR
ncbi:Glycosyl transferases group 1 [Fontimonas thermophila]|uniref:Glycosyl transferases group 1 n=1 Tax=Fontimonas thermophila TaxID=1076937 RepID=A0A1I2J0I0_9GAMM|nr:glycosyltransferase family 4 protein [Fontimonas thermophila]SFF47969.1 Glycosyl transferases group 1 [Fontimonas thermophila]